MTPAFAFLTFLSQPANASTYANTTVQHSTVADVDYTNADLKRLSPWLEAAQGAGLYSRTSTDLTLRSSSPWRNFGCARCLAITRTSRR